MLNTSLCPLPSPSQVGEGTLTKAGLGQGTAARAAPGHSSLQELFLCSGEDLELPRKGLFPFMQPGSLWAVPSLGKEQLLLKHTKRTYPRIAITSLRALGSHTCPIKLRVRGRKMRRHGLPYLGI